MNQKFLEFKSQVEKLKQTYLANFDLIEQDSTLDQKQKNEKQLILTEEFNHSVQKAQRAFLKEIEAGYESNKLAEIEKLLNEL
jgi:hypothetical protein